MPALVIASTISYLGGFVKHHPQEPCAALSAKAAAVGTGLARKFFRIHQHGGAA